MSGCGAAAIVRAAADRAEDCLEPEMATFLDVRQSVRSFA